MHLSFILFINFLISVIPKTISVANSDVRQTGEILKCAVIDLNELQRVPLRKGKQINHCNKPTNRKVSTQICSNCRHTHKCPWNNLMLKFTQTVMIRLFNLCLTASWGWNFQLCLGSVNCVLFYFKFLPLSLHGLDPRTADVKFVKHVVICTSTNYKKFYLTTLLIADIINRGQLHNKKL
jgi:hypothetical protein